MAARKEIIDFIEWERKNPEASILEVSEQSLKVVEIYSERKADTVTLVNDLLDLVVSYKIRGKHDPKTAFDYELVITSLIQSATDWNVILTEDEIKRFENVKVCDIKNLAEYIRTTYKPKQPISRPDGSIMDAENQPNPTTGDEDTIRTTTGDWALPEISEELYNEWHKGRCNRVLMRLLNKGFITKNGKVYKWKIDIENNYTNNLFPYFVFMACQKFGWLRGEKQTIPWKKFYPMFPNMISNRGAINQYIREIKNESYPTRATEIDNLFDW